MQIRNYRFRLYPRKKQIADLETILEGHRELYNAAIQERKEAWRLCRKSIGWYDQNNQLKAIRGCRNDIAALNYNSLQQTLRRVDKSFQNFFRRIKAGFKNGYPRFKSKGVFNSIVLIYGNGVKIKKNRLYLQSISDLIKIKWHRDIPKNGIIKQSIIKRTQSNKWYVCFQIETVAKKVEQRHIASVGIDFGLHNFAAFSDGKIIKKPKYFRMLEQKLQKQQRKVSRRKKFSNRRKKACKQVAITHEHIRNQRLDFHHKEARKIANYFSFIGIENLSLKGLHRTKLAKSFSDAGLGNFILILANKVEETGGELIKVNPAYSSQTCPNCGQIKKKELSERWHECDCGFECDRDVAAAQMILKFARTERSKHNVGVVIPKRTLRSRCVNTME